jgi:hypothetical protein
MQPRGLAVGVWAHARTQLIRELQTHKEQLQQHRAHQPGSRHWPPFVSG